MEHNPFVESLVSHLAVLENLVEYGAVLSDLKAPHFFHVNTLHIPCTSAMSCEVRGEDRIVGGSA
jgi:hypothetical protein